MPTGAGRAVARAAGAWSTLDEHERPLALLALAVLFLALACAIALSVEMTLVNDVERLERRVRRLDRAHPWPGGIGTAYPDGGSWPRLIIVREGAPDVHETRSPA